MLKPLIQQEWGHGGRRARSGVSSAYLVEHRWLVRLVGRAVGSCVDERRVFAPGAPSDVSTYLSGHVVRLTGALACSPALAREPVWTYLSTDSALPQCVLPGVLLGMLPSGHSAKVGYGTTLSALTFDPRGFDGGGLRFGRAPDGSATGPMAGQVHLLHGAARAPALTATQEGALRRLTERDPDSLAGLARELQLARLERGHVQVAWRGMAWSVT